MLSDDDEMSRIAATVQCGSVVAAAGCGKTEQIARATALSTGRRLILTHTHAGVEALRARLNKHGVAQGKYCIETIAGWSLRFAASFPKRSGISITQPSGDDWQGIYDSTATLICSGAVSGVLKASYDGLFVDEYQDCTSVQHEIICALAPYFPTCVFGDPLQAVFDFKGQTSVDWNDEVFPTFAKSGELTTPWRWNNAGNEKFAKWLKATRTRLEQGQPIDFSNSPDCVQWVQLPSDRKSPQARAAIWTACQSVDVGDNENLVVIGDSANLKSRALLARNLPGFTNIEPVGCQHLFEHAATIGSSKNVPRLDAVLEFAAACMTGTEKSDLLKAIQSHLAGGKRGAAKFGSIIPACLHVVQTDTFEPVLSLLDEVRARKGTRLYRREMFSAMRSALKLITTGQYESLADAAWETQNRVRHAGRRLAKRNVGSTLLVKGLEFDHAVIVDADRLCRKNLYVALTRPVRTVTVLSRAAAITPKT